MILKYAVFIFLIFGSMIFATNMMLISESYQAAPNGWVMELPKPSGTNDKLNNLVKLGILDESTIIETGLRGKPNQAALDNLEIASLYSIGESDANNSIGNLTITQTITNTSNTNNTELQEILNNTDATELSKYLLGIFKVMQ
jgi:hypothetical protein